MSTTPELKTIQLDEQVSLIQVERADIPAIFHTIDSQRAYLGEWLSFIDFIQEIGDIENFVGSIVDAPKEEFEYVFTVKKDKQFVGLIGFVKTDREKRQTEIGYWLAKEAQKQGIATQAVQKLCDFAFDEQLMSSIRIKCAVGNMPSKRVPQRLGFTLEKIEKDGEMLSNGVITDLEVYVKHRL